MSDDNALQPLSTAIRRRGLIVLLVDTFLMWGGFFMVIPLISVHYVDGLGWAAASIGLVLGMRQLTQQGLTLFGGALADMIGAKQLITLGMLIRAIGFAGMAWSSTLTLLFLSTFCAAIGGALFESPRMAAIAALTTDGNRSRFFSIAGIVGSLGMTLGPLLGAALLRIDFGFVALLAAGFFFSAFVITLVFLPPIRVATEKRSFTSGISMALHDRSFVLFTVLSMGFWFLWVQLTIALPLAAKAVSGTTDSVAWMYALNSGMTVVLQYPMLRLAERRFASLPVMIIGVFVMAIGLGAVSVAHSLPLLLVCVALFSLGAMLAMPSQQTVAADMANKDALGSYFGVNSLALAVGGSVGNVAGGMLHDWSLQLHLPSLPWLVCWAIGILTALGLSLLYWQRVRNTPTIAPALAE